MCNQIANSAFFPKSLFEEIGGYSDYCKHGLEDWDLCLSIMEKGYEVRKLEKVYCHFRAHKDEHRGNEADQHDLELRKAIFKNHLALYVDNEEFYERLKVDGPLYRQKYKKMQRLLNKLWPIALVELLVIVYLLLK